MTKYSELYNLERDKHEATKKALAFSEHNRELYRLFINECGHAKGFLLWTAKRHGFSEEMMDALRDVPDGDGQISSEPEK